MLTLFILCLANLCLPQCQKNSLMFLSRSFMVSAFTFSCYDLFKILFLCLGWDRSQGVFFKMNIKLTQNHLLQRPLFLHECSDDIAINQVTQQEGLFLFFLFCLSIHLLVLVLLVDSQHFKSSSFVLLSQCLGYSSSLEFLYEFQNQPFNFYKIKYTNKQTRTARHILGNATESIDHSGENWYLNKI